MTAVGNDTDDGGGYEARGFEYYEYAEIILHLADLYGIVWELSQHNYLTNVESIEIRNDSYVAKEDRPFLNVIKERLRKIEIAANNKIQPTADSGG